ncbi:MAG: amylo-alpha-1,6-glucosidase [Chitinispirillaceae bacterium]
MTKDSVLRKVPWSEDGSDSVILTGREWLVTNGLGGYSSGTVAGALTRRHHALLVAALSKKLGRTAMLSRMDEELIIHSGKKCRLGSEDHPKRVSDLPHSPHLSEFRLENGLPLWIYQMDDGTVLEKRVLMVHLQNTIHITYTLKKSSGACRLQLRPYIQFRSHNGAFENGIWDDYTLIARQNRFEIDSPADYPSLKLTTEGAPSSLSLDGGVVREVIHRVEKDRGYDSVGQFWIPGHFSSELSQGESVTLIASAEEWETVLALSADEARQTEMLRRQRLLEEAVPNARSGMAAELVLAADQFIISPMGRVTDSVRTHASGDEVKSVIAGYHWFTDWGRDTMISLEGLTLVTGRFEEAGWILRTFSHYIRDGLIPNLFPEGEQEGLYNTADATMWFFHALDRYLQYTKDKSTLEQLYDKLSDVIEHHVKGTRFGIGMDKEDGLLYQGAEGLQLTWMDAKVDDWVVTPRRGKTVEINALWYNALRLMERWATEERTQDEAIYFKNLAEKVKTSFNRKFWNESKRCLFDVIDGAEEERDLVRPNQIFSVSLPNPVLDPAKWKPVLNNVREHLFTPVGLRSLAPGSPNYATRYFGNLRTRDAAYHQGTIWGWLIGPFVDAYTKVYPDDHEGRRKLLQGFDHHLSEACIGSISEIFDGDSPFVPRGCVAQAWSVAEMLRCLVKVNGMKSVNH